MNYEIHLDEIWYELILNGDLSCKLYRIHNISGQHHEYTLFPFYGTTQTGKVGGLNIQHDGLPKLFSTFFFRKYCQHCARLQDSQVENFRPSLP